MISKKQFSPFNTTPLKIILPVSSNNTPCMEYICLLSCLNVELRARTWDWASEKASQPQGELNGLSMTVVMTRHQHALGCKSVQRPLCRWLLQGLWQVPHLARGAQKGRKWDTWVHCLFFLKVSILSNQHKQRRDKSQKTAHETLPLPLTSGILSAGYSWFSILQFKTGLANTLR